MRILKQYRIYLSDILGYLEGFCQKKNLLSPIYEIYNTELENFDINWKKKKIIPWKAYKDFVINKITNVTTKDWTTSSMPQASCDHKYNYHLSCRNNHKKRKSFANTYHNRCSDLTNPIIVKKLYIQIIKEILLNESKLTQLSKKEIKTIEDTLEHIDQKILMTLRDLEFDNYESQINHDSTEEENIDKSFNPLKLTHGSDGKSIPYWLFKLHGLNQTIECEICGNHIYEGRRAFEKHFKELRHQQGMQAFSVFNACIFFEITKIEDVAQLWILINIKEQRECHNSAAVQEFEDSKGNLYDLETYKLLMKQGIL